MKPIELRHRILETVSKNGGHLASSLGAVEIAMALADVFDQQNRELVTLFAEAERSALKAIEYG